MQATIGTKLRDHRRRKRLTQADAARQLGISQSLVSMVERGERVPRREIMRRIARMIGVSPSALWRMQ